MASRNVPDGDSVELYFAIPSTRITTATTFTVEAKYRTSGRLVDPAYILFATNEEAFRDITGGRISVRAGAHHFYICVRLNTADNVVNEIIDVSLLPLNNLDWFDDTKYKASAVIENRHVDAKFSIPVTISTDEGEVGIIDAVFDPPTEKPASFNCKITHITTNSTALDGIQISTDKGVSWTTVLNNVNFQCPSDSTGFKIKYAIKTNLVEEGNRYFDITTTETTAVKVFKPTVNIKTRVTVIDTTKLNYGDLIKTYCKDRDLYGVYSDGNHGSYEEPLILNAATCGYVILPPDTVMSTFCAGYTRVQHLSDGAGGYYRKVLAYNSENCGYTTPRELNPDKTVTPTTFDPTRKGNSVILNPDNDIFGALLRDNCLTKYFTRFGKWYFEVEIYLPTSNHLEVGLGFANTNVKLVEWIGANVDSWSWWPYDSTKYHSDKQGIYAQTVDVVDKDVIGVLLDMDNFRFGFSINGVFQGWAYEDLTDQKMAFVMAGRFDSWAFVNFGKYKFKYPVPAGFYSGIGTVANAPPEKGNVLGYYCAAGTVDQWVNKADGRGGSYTELFKKNVPECGWIDPKPPLGTILGFVCDGFDKYNKVADGEGGFTLKLLEINSLACGYKPPTEGSLSNVLINNAASYFDPAVILTGDKLSYTNLTKELVVDWGNLSGIWYWELNNWSGATYVGFSAYDSNHLSSYPTYNIWGNYGVAFEPASGMVNNRGVKEKMLNPVTEGSHIGFKIDFKAQTITIYTDGQAPVIITTKLNYPASSSTRLYPAVAQSTAPGGKGTFNFGQLPFHYADGNGNKPYQKPAAPFQQKGTALSYKCEVWVRWVSRADGNGGSYSEIYENNSPTCGWYPDPAIGTILGYYCVGYARYKTVANGNYTTIDVLIDAKSTDCGYIPAGTIISLYCVNKDQWVTKSDGNGGSYNELLKVNSANCGFVETSEDFSDQLADVKFDIRHARALPVVGYDIIHTKNV